eukprot:NODE_2505_length_922_cov_336.003460.p1 GENE.NODE_2505_length_922_cov_336.003460~~NODE_2505_length_922_cov_336.003460.p1  ORF type:complete len:293 (+),score=78.55 NODE_2505_length_922_cov_336.003460:3-881(+)
MGIGYVDDAFFHSPDDFTYEDTYNGFMNWMENVTAAMPYMVLPGNHEVECHSSRCVLHSGLHESLHNFSAYNARWRMPWKPSGGVLNMWHSFNYGGVHFVAMNSETDFPTLPRDRLYAAGGFAPSGTYLKWLEADLRVASEERERGGRQFIVVGAHRPFAEVMHDGVCELFVKYGVDLFVAGHVHAYARVHWPKCTAANAAGAAHGGLVEIVAGGTGSEEFPVDKNKYPKLCEKSGCKYRVANAVQATGILRVAGGRMLEYTLIASGNGAVLDHIQLTRPPATGPPPVTALV